jgi:hypothetical protein
VVLQVDHGHAVTCLAPLDFGGPDQGERGFWRAIGRTPFFSVSFMLPDDFRGAYNINEMNSSINVTRDLRVSDSWPFPPSG